MYNTCTFGGGRGMTQKAKVEWRLAPLRGKQKKEAMRVLARAFHADGMFTYVFPDESARARHLPGVMRSGLSYGLKYGQVHVSAGEVEGVCVTALRGAPYGPVPRPSLAYRLGLTRLRTRLAYGKEAYIRYLLASAAVRELHVRNISGPHWYLLLLGVDPPRQGTGLGAALLQQLLLRADGERLPIYLDTFKKDNLTFYQKFGFEVKQELAVDRGLATVWAMVRPAKK